MSRSKEGREQNAPTESRSTEATLDDRLGAIGQTDYTSGRESYRDFPRRSTSARTRDDLYPSGDIYGERYRPGRSDYGNRMRAETPSRYDQARGRTSRYRDQERSRNYGREPYNDSYNREAMSRDYERDFEYDRDYTPSIGAYGWGVGRGIDTEQWRRERRERNILRCRDIMTKDVTTISPRQTVREAADMMEDENVGSIPVLDNGRLIGIVTDRDIVCRVVAEGKDTRATPVSEAMSEDIVTCSTDDTVQDAIRKMAENQVRRLPAIDFNGRLRGIVAMADIALEAERDRDLAQALEEISRPTPNRSRRG